MERSRDIVRKRIGEGMPCIGPTIEREECALKACALTGDKVDCELADWGTWGSCTAKCGGQQYRDRYVLVPPRNGGRACTGKVNETQECGGDDCVGDTQKSDCRYNTWEDWSGCSSCNAQRKRVRHIAQLAANGGRDCNETAVEELGDCSDSCTKRHWCSWNHWQDWGPCSRTCGPGNRSRSRHLAPSRAPSEDNEEELWDSGIQILGDKVAGQHPNTHGIEVRRVQELVIAFVCGCVTIWSALALFRFCGESKRHTTASLNPSYTELPIRVASARGLLIESSSNPHPDQVEI